jgi:hypothetical protein
MFNFRKTKSQRQIEIEIGNRGDVVLGQFLHCPNFATCAATKDKYNSMIFLTRI